jgi:hypothetical protein
VTKQKTIVEVDVEALARALVPLLIPPLVAALADSNASPARARRIPLPPPPPPRRLWTQKEAAEWEAAAPEYRIVWDEQGQVLGLHQQTPGTRYWEIVGWNESRTRAWLQLALYVKWHPEQSWFWMLRKDQKQPDPDGDPAVFERWQAWCVMHPASESGPIYPWGKPTRRRKTP